MIESIGTMDIRISEIHIDPQFNCRGDISILDVKELSDDIRFRGLIQPVSVMLYGEYKQNETGFKHLLIAGYRRTMACKIIGLEVIKATIYPQMTEADARLFNLAENIQRQELNILQEAQVIKVLMDLGLSESDCLKSLPGKSRGWVQIRTMLLRLPKEIQQDAAAGLIRQNDLRQLHTINSNPNINDVDKGNMLAELAKKLKGSKEKGQEVDFVKKYKRRGESRPRNIAEITKMIEYIGIAQQLPMGLWSRCMAWCAGKVTTGDLHQAAKEFADKAGLKYIIPGDFISLSTDPVNIESAKEEE